MRKQFNMNNYLNWIWGEEDMSPAAEQQKVNLTVDKVYDSIEEQIAEEKQ